MKIRIPKNRRNLKQHLHDPLSAGAGFFFRIFAARLLYAAEDVGLGSALISAMGHLSHALPARLRHRADQAS